MSAPVDLTYLCRALLKYGASDLHLKSGRPPMFRINGDLRAAKMPELASEEMQQLFQNVLTQKQVQELNEKRQIDFSFAFPELGRFRCNLFFQRNCISAAIRVIPLVAPMLKELRLPRVIQSLCDRERGLILVTGQTGSGKSTTLAAMIHYMNERKNLHIITIEDPIEFLFKDQKSSITQREVGADTPGLEEGLYAALRQDPDVIVIGELRNFRMVQLALTAAETGHLVISTMHTYDAVSTLQRLLEVFPSEYQNQARMQLASSLVATVSQQLVVRQDGKGQVPACEVLIASPTVESYIQKNQIDKIPELIGNSKDYYEMQSMNQSLERLVAQGLITLDEALRASSNPDDLRLKMSGIARDQGYEMALSLDRPKTDRKSA